MMGDMLPLVPPVVTPPLPVCPGPPARGNALVPAVLCQPWFDSGALVRIEALEVTTDDAYYLVARPDDLSRPEVRALTSWTLQQFQESA